MIDLKWESWQIKIETKRTHRIHPACTPSSPTERDLSSLSLEKGGQRERQTKREGNRWRDTETKTECSCMCVVTCTRVCFHWMPKKVGQWIWHHLLRGKDGEKKRLEMMSRRSQRTKEWKHDRRRDITEKKKKLKWGDKTSRREKRKGGRGKAQVASLLEQMWLAPPPVSGYLATKDCH